MSSLSLRPDPHRAIQEVSEEFNLDWVKVVIITYLEQKQKSA